MHTCIYEFRRNKNNRLGLPFFFCNLSIKQECWSLLGNFLGYAERTCGKQGICRKLKLNETKMIDLLELIWPTACCLVACLSMQIYERLLLTWWLRLDGKKWSPHFLGVCTAYLLDRSCKKHKNQWQQKFKRINSIKFLNCCKLFPRTQKNYHLGVAWTSYRLRTVDHCCCYRLSF